MNAQRTFVPAFQALRTYWGTAMLLVAACAAGLAVIIPVTSLAAWGGAGVTPTIALAPVRDADVGIAWGALAQTPTEIRRAALGALVRLLLGVAAGVLAVTCLTTLSLSTARADARATEVAVHRAVGASRGRLLAALVVEGGAVAALVAVAGGIAGLLAARLVAGAWPGAVGPAARGFGGLAVAVTLGGILLGALFPLVFARRSSHIAVPESTPVGLAVPAAQLGVSLTVLVLASLLGRGATRLTAPAGARAGAGEVFQLTLADRSAVGRAAGYAELLRRLHAVHEIEVAGLATPGALAGVGTTDIAWTDYKDCAWGFVALALKPCYAAHYAVSADTFRALGLPLVAGRDLTDADAWDTERVVVVSRSLAPQSRPSAALGRTLRVGRLPSVPYTVVGVVEDQQPAGFGGGLVPPYAIYLSMLQHPATAADLLVRGRGGAGVPTGQVLRSLASAFGPGAAAVRRVSEVRLKGTEAAPLRWFARMFGLEGWTLLAISTVGTFAMMWLWVASLEGELGVRRAVGARRRRILGYVLIRAVLVAAGGVAVGAWLGMMAWDAMGNLVAGLPAWDSDAVLRCGVLLGVAALAGAMVPALRAASAPPVRLLAP